MKECDNKKCSRHCEITERNGGVEYSTGFKQELDIQEYNSGIIYKGLGNLSFCSSCSNAVKMALENAGITTEVVE